MKHGYLVNRPRSNVFGLNPDPAARLDTFVSRRLVLFRLPKSLVVAGSMNVHTHSVMQSIKAQDKDSANNCRVILHDMRSVIDVKCHW